MKPKTLIKGALILMIANIVTRLLGFIYRVYMSNVIGAEGIGLYQLIVPIYMLIWSICSSGFSTTVSKLTAQENAKKEYGNITKILKLSTATSVTCAIVLSVAVYVFSDFIGVHILKDIRTISSLKIITYCFPFMAAGSCIRGYFFGLQKSSVPAASQVIEQITRMAVIYFLASIFISKGIEFASMLAVLGMCVGEIVSFFYVLCSYGITKKQIKRKKPSLKTSNAYAMIMTMALPLTANRMTGSLLSTAENILIPERLRLSGLSAAGAMSVYGELTGMAMPLLMFPSSLLTALSITLVPAVSEAFATGIESKLRGTLSASMLITILIGIGAGGIFIAFSDEIAIFIYNQKSIGDLLFLMGAICPLLYCQVTLSGILNGLGEQMFIFRNSLIASGINIFFIYFLIPVYGIKVFILGWLTSLVVVNFLDFGRVISKTRLKISLKNSIFKPLVCISASLLFTRLIYIRFFGVISFKLGVVIIIFLSMALYILFLFQTGCIGFEILKKVIGKKAK